MRTALTLVHHLTVNELEPEIVSLRERGYFGVSHRILEQQAPQWRIFLRSHFSMPIAAS